MKHVLGWYRLTKDKDLSSYPESITFKGVGNVSLKQIHLIALSVVVLGVVFAVLAPPGGYIALLIFLIIAAGYDLVFIRKSQHPVQLTLYLRRDPVEASYDEGMLGPIDKGTIVRDMDAPNELGFRPAANRRLMVWEFQSEQDAKIVAKRLLEYLPEEK